MTITEYASYVREHPLANEETASSTAITQRLPAFDDPNEPPASVDPANEESYWSGHFARQPYVQPGEPYSRFRAAYRFGWEARAQYTHRTWADVELHLKNQWQRDPANYDFDWNRARPAVRDAWDRLTRH